MPVRIIMDKTDERTEISLRERKIINSFPDNTKSGGGNWRNLLIAIHKRGGEIFEFAKYMNDYWDNTNHLTADFEGFHRYLILKLPINEGMINNWWNEVMMNYKILERVK